MSEDIHQECGAKNGWHSWSWVFTDGQTDGSATIELVAILDHLPRRGELLIDQLACASFRSHELADGAYRLQASAMEHGCKSTMGHFPQKEKTSRFRHFRRSSV